MGQTLGSNLEDHYFLQKVKLGEGSFGVVWRARAKQSNAIVAIKQIDKNKMVHRGATRDDILREIEMMRACKHPNITELYDTFEDSTYISLALEYCDGGDFGDKVNERALDLQEHEAAEWAGQICSAIACLHEKDICHRDIKPDNFMVSGNQLKLCDFGLAIQLRWGELINTRCGTPAFMAPEQLRLPDTPGYSHPVDLWAAGITLYMLMCGGKHPFISDNGAFSEMLCYSGHLDFSVHDGFQFLRGRGRPPQFGEAPRSLARRLVEPDANKRISARGALEDPWLNAGANRMPGLYNDPRLQRYPYQHNGNAYGAPPGQPNPAMMGGPSSAAFPNGAPSAASASNPTPANPVAALAAAAIVVPALAIAAVTAPAEGNNQAACGEVAGNYTGAGLMPNPKRRSARPAAGVGGPESAPPVCPMANSPALAAAGEHMGGAKPVGSISDERWKAENARAFDAPPAEFIPDRKAGAQIVHAQPENQAFEPQLTAQRHRANAPKRLDQRENQVATIVMVGPTGQGKSTLGNMLAGGGQGYMPFKTSDDFDSETLDCAHADFNYELRQHRAIDTIGFLDTRMDAAENMDKFSCFADRAPAGIDAFVFVLKKGRFTEQSLGQLVAFRSIAGETAMSYTILVFTHCGAETNESLRERCENSANQHLKAAVDSCATVLGVDSLDLERCDADRVNLLSAIQDLIKSHGGVKYDNVALTEARERRLELKEQIQGLSAERQDMMKDKMDALFNGRLTFEQVQKAVEDALASEERERKAAAERVSLQALLAAAKSEASAWKEVARNALRGSAGNQGSSLGLAGCCTAMPAMDA